MIRPRHFGYNEETAGNNAFQRNDGELAPDQIASMALTEFDRMVQVLREAGIEVLVVEDRDEPVTRDAVFPNNWFSTHRDGTVVTYPLFSKERRWERREDILNLLGQHYRVNRRLQFENAEVDGHFLEGTGSLILDRQHRIAYACRSIRTNEELFRQWAERMGYSGQLFDAYDARGLAIYHTNVMMALGGDFVVWGGDALPHLVEREAVERLFVQTGKAIIPISLNQMDAFSGNMLALKNREDENILVMSTTAHRSLESGQRETLARHAHLVLGDIPTIERYGGGSVRCMMAEIFLKPA